MKNWIVALSVLLLPFASIAADGKKMGTMAEGEPDKIEGCGLGWQVTNKRTFLGTTTRQTTNAFVPPTFGMTSGTIGCEQLTFAKNETEGVHFAVTNRDALSVELAQGQGEFVTSFAHSMGCVDSSVGSFAEKAQQNYGKLFQSGKATGVDLYRNTKVMIESDATLSQQCRLST